MVMKNYFAKENFIISECDKKQKRQSLVISICIMVMFIFSALTFFNAMYAFADCVGSIVSGSPDVALKDAYRSAPLFLTCIMSIWGLLTFHSLFRNIDDTKRSKSLKKNCIVILALAAANIIGIFEMRFTGKFHSLVEGSPSALYPLDSLLYTFFFVALGVFGLVYNAKLSAKIPFVSPSRAPVAKRARGLYCTFLTFWMLFSLFCFAAFVLGLFIHDFSHGYLPYSIALMVVYCINFVFILVWEFFYNELKEEKRKELLLGIAICGLCVSLCAAIFYFVGLGIDKDAPANAGFGILPVTFTASVNFTTLLEVFCPVIVSVVALLKGISYRKSLNAKE